MWNNDEIETMKLTEKIAGICTKIKINNIILKILFNCVLLGS